LCEIWQFYNSYWSTAIPTDVHPVIQFFMVYQFPMYSSYQSVLQFLMLYKHRVCVRSGSVTILIGLRPISNVFRLLISFTILYALRAWDLWGSSAVTILDALRAWGLCEIWQCYNSYWSTTNFQCIQVTNQFYNSLCSTSIGIYGGVLLLQFLMLYEHPISGNKDCYQQIVVDDQEL